MDSLSAAVSVIAVVQILAQALEMCRTHYSEVKDATYDIQRLRNEMVSFHDVLDSLAELLEDARSPSYQS